MRYVEKKYHIEHHPENLDDVEYLKERFCIDHPFKFVCTARKANQVIERIEWQNTKDNHE